MRKIYISPDTEKAARRLSSVINCDSILRYAAKVRNPRELEMIGKIISDICIHSDCSKADAVECIDYIHALEDECYEPKIVHQHNSQCQQFYGRISDSDFYNSNNRLTA